MKKLYILTVMVFAVNVSAQNISFADTNLKQTLLSASTTNGIAKDTQGLSIAIDTNGDNEISVQEALTVYQLWMDSKGISNLSGLQNFVNLTRLVVNENPISALQLQPFPNLTFLACSWTDISSLDLTFTPLLNELECSYTEMTSINVQTLTLLKILTCAGNTLTQLDVTQNPLLTSLDCSANSLNQINLTQNPLLEHLSCHNNQLSTLDLSQNMSLSDLTANYNQLSVLDVSNHSGLYTIYCNNNQLTTINISGIPMISKLDCSHNLLTHVDFPAAISLGNGGGSLISFASNNLITLNIKNGWAQGVDFSNNPNLQYICIDEQELSLVQSQLAFFGYTNVNVNPYCTFEPGGTVYDLQLANKFDADANGCDSTELSVPAVKYAVSNGTDLYMMQSAAAGTLGLSLPGGNYTVVPMLENASYFTVSPETLSVSFPLQAGIAMQNFCITPNGTHRDIDVNIIPTTPAVPGFDVTYKIIYRNIGNTTVNGSVNLSYNDLIFDFVWAGPANNLLPAGLLNWNFANLIPFETREIYFTLNLNGPMDAPAVNSGDVVSLIGNATITNAVDENPTDNTMNLMQTVVNAMDPNDKICLEGTTITPEMVGKYVHYKIRFENEGTAPAKNIVVKDMIDMAKFDITSLIPLDSNYPFTTRITNTNQVEFIFENINLSFDDDLNDGYVVFKIKTLPTLVAGNTFSNTASIYFDYNFPIITDPAVTTVQVLGVSETAADTFAVYPNPTSGTLAISAKDRSNVTSVSVYTVLGQMVQAVKGASIETIDVSRLNAGTYFITIQSDKGSATAKFIKK